MHIFTCRHLPLFLLLTCTPLCSEESSALSPTPTDLLAKADEYYDAGLYLEAEEIYKTLLGSNLPPSLAEKARLHLAHTYFILEEYPKTIDLLTPPPTDTSDSQHLFLLGLSYSRYGNLPKAIESLTDYLPHAPTSRLDEANFELGVAKYRSGNSAEARSHFQAISPSPKNGDLLTLSKLYLEKIQKADQPAQDATLNRLGAIYYIQGDFAEAEKAYLKLIADYPDSPYASEAWFWSGCCSDKLQNDPLVGRQRRKHVFENYPASPQAPEAYFTYYSSDEYLQGDRTAIRHLQNFPDLYPDSPFLMEAEYLLGLDYKRDRKTPEGKWIRRKSLTDAIDHFHRVETSFDTLLQKDLLPKDKLNYYTAVRYRATLERAMANLNIADESLGAKRQIYLEYAEDVFKELVADFKAATQSLASHLIQDNPFPPIYEESLFWLAQTSVRQKRDEAAKAIFTEMLDIYNRMETTKGYYLSRVWDELGRIALRAKDYPLALESFKQAEGASRGASSLSTDQRLDLWIQQSAAYRGLQQYDQAILILSKVINDNAISPLRMQAMFLRAETYQEQGRPELARKQLESIVKMGGLWSTKAQEKLKNNKLKEAL